MTHSPDRGPLPPLPQRARPQLWVAIVVTLLLVPLLGMYGPMLAPEALNVMAPWACEDATAARTRFVGRRGRSSGADHWELECRSASGALLRAPGERAMAASFLCFGGGALVAMSAALTAYALLERRLRGAAR